MARYPVAIEQLIQAFTLLPGVGRKTAERYTLFLLKQAPEVIRQFNVRLTTAEDAIQLCEQCGNYAIDILCDICVDAKRDQSQICVVSESAAIFAFEQTGQHRGTYHVLGGTINQLEGIGPEQLNLESLVKRVENLLAQTIIPEIILATNPDLAGEATSLYIIDAMKPYQIKITRLARGLASGTDIEFADDLTLRSALLDRKVI